MNQRYRLLSYEGVRILQLPPDVEQRVASVCSLAAGLQPRLLATDGLFGTFLETASST